MSSLDPQQGRSSDELTESELRAEAHTHLHAAMEALAEDDFETYEAALNGAKSYGRRLAPGWSQ